MQHLENLITALPNQLADENIRIQLMLAVSDNSINLQSFRETQAHRNNVIAFKSRERSIGDRYNRVVKQIVKLSPYYRQLEQRNEAETISWVFKQFMATPTKSHSIWLTLANFLPQKYGFIKEVHSNFSSCIDIKAHDKQKKLEASLEKWGIRLDDLNLSGKQLFGLAQKPVLYINKNYHGELRAAIKAARKSFLPVNNLQTIADVLRIPHEVVVKYVDSEGRGLPMCIAADYFNCRLATKKSTTFSENINATIN